MRFKDAEETTTETNIDDGFPLDRNRTHIPDLQESTSRCIDDKTEMDDEFGCLCVCGLCGARIVEDPAALSLSISLPDLDGDATSNVDKQHASQRICESSIRTVGGGWHGASFESRKGGGRKRNAQDPSL